jgi:hypothetical protein
MIESSSASNTTPLAETPSKFIKIINHPHSGISDPTIIPLEGTINIDSQASPTLLSKTGGRPWAPFRTRADFEYTETAVLGLLNKEIVNKQLNSINNSWSSHSAITFRSATDMEQSLQAARAYGVPVRS